MQSLSSPIIPDAVQAQASIHHSNPIEDSWVPRIRRNFRFFSEQGIMTCGGGVVSGDLRIQLRKGFMNRTRVMVSYAHHRVFVEVEGSPLQGNLRSNEILGRLRSTGSVC